MKKYPPCFAASTLAVLSAGFTACSASVERTAQDFEAELSAQVNGLLAPLVDARAFSGAVVLMRAGEVVYQRGFGVANHAFELAFQPNTPVDGGSLAKTFTAAGLWWLAEEGLVDLDAAVHRHVPEYPHADTTVRQLLAHSNGLPSSYGFFDPYFGPGEVWTTPAMLALVAEHAVQPVFAPGSRYEYSNLGYDAAGLLIERVTGQSYEGFVSERFFKPLGMTSSFARPARLADWPGLRTQGYRWQEGEWLLNDAIDLEGFLGASNLYFSAADLARWGDAMAAGSALPAEAFAAAQQPLSVAGLPLPLTGLSWYCDEQAVRCNYTGHHAGFHSFLHGDRERREVVAFVSNSSLPAWATASLQRELVSALAGRPGDPDPDQAFLTLAEILSDDLAGVYAAPGLAPIALTVGDDGIEIRVDQGLAFRAFPADRTVLYVPGLDYWLAFSGDPDERRMHLKSQQLNLVAPRIQ